MDLEDIENLFSDVSEGVQALISGVALIITLIFFVYAVIPIYGDHPNVVLFSLLSLLVCFLAPFFFRLPDMTLVPDVLGWLLTGIAIAIFGWIIFHAGYYIDILSLGYILPSGLLGFASSLPLTEGVLIPLYGGEVTGTFKEDLEAEEDEFEDEFESDFEEDFGEDEVEEETFEDEGTVEVNFDNHKELERKDDDGPW